MDDGPAPLEVEAEAAVRRQARRVRVRSFLAALAVTLVVWLLP
jgi:hypothetical protein